MKGDNSCHRSSEGGGTQGFQLQLHVVISRWQRPIPGYSEAQYGSVEIEK